MREASRNAVHRSTASSALVGNLCHESGRLRDPYERSMNTTTNELRQRRMERLVTRAPNAAPVVAHEYDAVVEAPTLKPSQKPHRTPAHRVKAYLLATALLALIALVQVWVVS